MRWWWLCVPSLVSASLGAPPCSGPPDPGNQGLTHIVPRSSYYSGVQPSYPTGQYYPFFEPLTILAVLAFLAFLLQTFHAFYQINNAANTNNGIVGNLLNGLLGNGVGGPIGVLHHRGAGETRHGEDVWRAIEFYELLNRRKKKRKKEEKKHAAMSHTFVPVSTKYSEKKS